MRGLLFLGALVAGLVGGTAAGRKGVWRGLDGVTFPTIRELRCLPRSFVAPSRQMRVRIYAPAEAPRAPKKRSHATLTLAHDPAFGNVTAVQGKNFSDRLATATLTEEPGGVWAWVARADFPLRILGSHPRGIELEAYLPATFAGRSVSWALRMGNGTRAVVFSGVAPFEPVGVPRPRPSPEEKAPETTSPETRAPEEKAPETTSPETTSPEEKAPETTSPEERAPETTSPEKKYARKPCPPAVPREVPREVPPPTEKPRRKCPEREACQVPGLYYALAVLAGAAATLPVYAGIVLWHRRKRRRRREQASNKQLALLAGFKV